MNKLSTPNSDEYAEFYAGYVQRAASKGDVLLALSNQVDEIKIALGNLSDEQALFRDAPNEWSIKEMMGACRDWLKKGASVMMFPEGTRTQNGELLPFRAGGFSLALELGLPIVPVAISGTFEVFPKGRNELRTFHPMRARVLPPLMPEDYAGKPGKMKEDAQKLISDALVQLRAENSIGTTAGAKEELVGAKKD